MFGILSTYVTLEGWSCCKNVGQGRFRACQGWNIWIDPHSIGLLSTHADCLGLIRFDLVMIWKSFNSDKDLGLESLFEVARDGYKRGHRFKLVIPVCQSKVGRRFFAVKSCFCVGLITI